VDIVVNNAEHHRASHRQSRRSGDRAGRNGRELLRLAAPRAGAGAVMRARGATASRARSPGSTCFDLRARQLSATALLGLEGRGVLARQCFGRDAARRAGVNVFPADRRRVEPAPAAAEGRPAALARPSSRRCRKHRGLYPGDVAQECWRAGATIEGVGARVVA